MSLQEQIVSSGSAALSSLGEGASPQTQILLQSGLTIMGAALGGSPQELIGKVATEIANQAAAAAVSVVGDVAGAVPLVGQAVQAAFVIFDAAIADGARRVAVANAYEKQFADGFSLYRPIGTGPGGRVMPCDILAPYDADDAVKLGVRYTTGSNQTLTNGVLDAGWLIPTGGGAERAAGPSPGGMAIRPTLGNLLMMVTEIGGDADRANPVDPSWRNDQAIDGPLHAPVVGAIRKFFAAGGKTVGVPKETRQLFRQLRLAIAGQRKHEPRATVDGGVGLWTAYLDLLSREFALGHLTDEYVRWLTTVNGFQNGMPTVRDGAKATAEANVGAIRTLVDNWNQTVHPWYSLDAAEQEQVASEARQIVNAHLVQFMHFGGGQHHGSHKGLRFDFAKDVHPVVLAGGGLGLAWLLFKVLK